VNYLLWLAGDLRGCLGFASGDFFLIVDLCYSRENMGYRRLLINLCVHMDGIILCLGRAEAQWSQGEWSRVLLKWERRLKLLAFER